MILDVGHATKLGQEREQGKHYHSVAQHWVTDAQLAERGRLFLIADDLRGPSPDEPSRHAVSRVAQLYYTQPSSDARQGLQQAIRRVNAELYGEGVRHQRRECVALLALAISDAQAVIVSVGNARAYLLRRHRLRPLTPARSLEEMSPAPESQEPDKETTPAYSLGWSPHPLADMVRQTLSVGDKLLLCTQEVSEAVRDEELCEALETADSAQAAAERLTAIAQERGQTEATAVVINVVARGAKEGRLPFLASWLFWGIVGVAVAATVIAFLAWTGTSPPPVVTPSPTLTRPKTASLPAILRPTLTLPPAELKALLQSPTPTAPPTATSQPRPTNTRPRPTTTATATATVLPVLYPAVELIAPHEGEAIYQGENNRLIWRWSRKLRAGERYEIRLWPDTAAPPSRGTMYTEESQLRFGLPVAGKYYWDVTVVRQAPEGSMPVSERSETRSFWWMGPRGEQPTPTITKAPTETTSPTTAAIPPTPTLPPTDTPPPTSTPVPPTTTPLPPTDTPLPPTDTPLPPTPTPLP